MKFHVEAWKLYIYRAMEIIPMIVNFLTRFVNYKLTIPTRDSHSTRMGFPQDSWTVFLQLEEEYFQFLDDLLFV